MRGRVWKLMLALSVAACEAEVEDTFASDIDTSLYALVTTVDGATLYPPLAPQPAGGGVFRGGLLDRLEIVLESTDENGFVSTVATFDRTTSARVMEMTHHQVYFVNVPAAAHFTNPSPAYNFRVLYGGLELARSDLSSAVFDVLARVPELRVGVRVLIESRAVDRDGDGILDVDDPCPYPEDEVCDGADNDCDGLIDNHDVCVRSCDVENGSGTQLWTGTEWGACTVESCNDGYHLQAGACASNIQSCTVMNGTGEQTWNGTDYGACLIVSCNAGYSLQNGACYSSYFENRNNAGVSNIFTVPASCPRVRVQAWGAGGGGRQNQYVGRGGGGGYVEAIIPVTQGQQLLYIVGGGGRTGANGGAGGANGGAFGSDAGGGGMSHVALNGTSTILVSAGGGGGGTGTTLSDYPGTWIWGREGGAESAGGSGYFNGSGGTPTTAGVGGDVNGICRGSNGGWGFGGAGSSSSRSGGGGGGHYGGGGGRCNKGGGGGGANYINRSATLAIVEVARNAGSFDIPGNASSPDRAGAGNGGIGDQNGAAGRIILTCTGL